MNVINFVNVTDFVTNESVDLLAEKNHKNQEFVKIQ